MGIDTRDVFVVPREQVYLSMVDYTKWSDDLKLEFITMEIGHDADVQTFADKYLEIFRDKICTGRQQSRCLALFRNYAKVAETEDTGPYENLITAQ